MKAELVKNQADIFGKKIKIFENAQNTQIRHKTENEKRLLVIRVFFHAPTAEIIYDGGGGQQAAKPRRDPAVKDITGEEQKSILEKFLANDPITKEDAKQEIDIVKGCENHEAI